MDARLLLKSAQVAVKEGRFRDAEASFQDAIIAQPDLAAAVFGLISLLNARDEEEESRRILRALITVAPTHANITAAARQWREWDIKTSSKDVGSRLRLALSGHGTLEPLGDYLRVALAQEYFDAPTFVSGFDQWAQDLLDSNSELYAHRPDVIALRFEADALFPKSGDQAGDIAVGLARIEEVLDAATKHAPNATLLIQTFPVPDYAPLGMLDLLEKDGQRARFGAINTALFELARTRKGRLLLLDAERLEARHGKGRVRDARLWYMASLPYSESFLPVLAQGYVALLRALKGKTKKCIVLDLDNTLWGGVIGEDGIAGIKIGGTGAPGNAFADFQRALLDLRDRGILLAVCSKNNPDDIWPVFDSHPEMQIKREHIAAWRVGWQDKATSIREIAKELNIGRDSLVFLDDNPMERGLVQQELPEVMTPELPRDPALYTTALNALTVFETVVRTEEDKQRSRLYQEQQERKAFAAALGVEEGELGASDASGASGGLTEYLRRLSMVVTLATLTPFTVPRVAQLLGKTNQFNVTTRRHTEAQIQNMLENPNDWGVWTVRVSDRFGDSGLTGVAIVHKGASEWEVDSFLLSCRILGRGVEDALMTCVIHAAHAAGATVLRGLFLPTTKNAPAAGFFIQQGFSETRYDSDARYFALDLADAVKRVYPDWLTVIFE